MADAFQPRFADLVRNDTTTAGTGDFLLGPAANGFSSFTDACAVGEQFYYSALGIDNPADTEVGRGTLLAGGVIARDPINGKKTNFKAGTTSVSLVAAAEWYSQVDADRASNVRSFGATGDGVTDDTAAIQAALDHVGAIGGGALYFPEGTYVVSSFLTVHRGTLIRGAGRQASIIESAHSGGGGATPGESVRNGSCLVTESPLNGSTPINVVIADITIRNVNAANEGAAYYDTGGTFVLGTNAGFIGFKYGVVLDQSELVDFDLCEFSAQNAGGAGVWIVNGGDLDAQSQPGYSNRIAIKRCQLNQTGETIGITDDGGYAHVFEDNNYNGCKNWIRCCGAVADIRGGEFEGAADHGIVLSYRTISGRSTGGNNVAVRGGLYIAGTGLASIYGDGSPGSLQVDGMASFNGSGGAHPIMGSGSFWELVLLSYANGSGAPSVRDGNASHMTIDTSASAGFQVNGIVLGLDGKITAANVGTAAAYSASDFLQPSNNLSEIADRIAAAKNLGSGIVLAQSADPVVHTGDTAEFTLSSVTIPANAIGANGRIEVRARFRRTTGSGSYTVSTKFGGTAIASTTQAATTVRHLAEIQNRASSAAQYSAGESINSGGNGTYSENGALTLDTTASVDVTITAALTNPADSVALQSYQIILYPKD